MSIMKNGFIQIADFDCFSGDITNVKTKKGTIGIIRGIVPHHERQRLDVRTARLYDFAAFTLN